MRTPKPKHSFNRTNQAACRFKTNPKGNYPLKQSWLYGAEY